jgi:hypothetical protein
LIRRQRGCLRVQGVREEQRREESEYQLAQAPGHMTLLFIAESHALAA